MTRNTELTIEDTAEQVRAYEAAKAAYMVVQEEFNPSLGRVRTVRYDLENAQERFSVAHARLCLSLAAQLQQEREARERMEKALEWYAEPSIYQQEHFEGTGMEYPALVDGGHSARLALNPEVAQ